MKKAPDFASLFQDDFREYVRFMKDNGRVFQVETSILKAFDRYLCLNNCDTITKDVAVRFAFSIHGLTDTQYQKRHRTIRKFVEYRALKGSGEEIAPLPKARSKGRSVPHLYSQDEISTMLDAAGNLTPKDSLRPHTYQVILGLLVCTGMRISEILNLEVSDVDLQSGVIHIRNTKFKKSRLVPIHFSALTVLKKYVKLRAAHFPASKCNSFFLNNRGSRVIYGTSNATFLSIVRRVGIRPAEGRGSRTHHLRHTFAVNRLSAWYDEGADIHEMLPVLSTFMGHAHFEDTVYYLNMSADLMAKGSTPFQFGGDSDE